MMLPQALPTVLGLLAFASFAAAGNSTFYSGIDPCPVTCNNAGSNPNNWTVYGSQDRINLCDHTMLIDLALYAPISSDSPTAFHSCTGMFDNSEELDSSILSSQADLQLAWSNLAATSSNNTQVVAAARQVQGFLANTATARTTHVFAHLGDAVVGAYVGSNFLQPNMATSTIQSFIDQYSKRDKSESILIQLCGAGRNGNQVFGIAASIGPSAFSTVQAAVRSWSDATCVALDALAILSNSTVYETVIPTTAISNATNSTQTLTRGDHKRAIFPRSDCTTTRVVSGDSCASLVARCGITAAQLTTYNPSSTLCSTLAVGQYVCCSSGTLPDMTPKENSDGSCFSYTTNSGDFCAMIAASYSITIDKIESYNKNTWEWTNCTLIQPGVKICLSPGTPPMPAPRSGDVCGPRVPNTKVPSKGNTLASLNPCPLNACCDIWGQCGTTAEFCTKTGSNRCISNCGQDIIKGASPAQFRKIGYFEGYTSTRPCLVADVGGLNFRDYTHVHMAFAGLTPAFTVDVSTIKSQFDEFVAMKGASAKRILAIGGWAFSTDPSTYMIFRNAVQPANWETVALSIATFLDLHGLDGVDLDWEYPGATDIPGVPAGDPLTEGTNYLGLIYHLRASIGAKRTISVALPASYWYLRNFPVAEMALLVDYFVYMTYDLHGQWDYGNKWSDPGCPGGNCLRSHVNLTETLDALAMVTKAGVPSGQLAIGVSSYGRSFQMVTPGCTGETCLYTGPLSGAKRGPCTDVAGYISDAEIKAILTNDSSAKTYLDGGSYSNIMIYGGDQWVSYMDEANRATRALVYKSYNMGGITNWAVDLEDFAEDAITPYRPISKEPIPNWKTVTCTNPGIADASTNQTVRWNDAYADDAWAAAVANWTAKPNPGGLTFIQQISNFFSGPENLGCGGIGADGCDLSLECGSTHYPAGYFILNSLSVIDDMNNNFYSAIVYAESYMTTQMGTFAYQFAPIENESNIEKIVLDLVGLAFALVASPAWNVILKGMAFWKANPNALGTLKDSVNPLVSNSITISKDSSVTGQTLNAQNTLETSMGNMIKVWAIIVEALNGQLFNGSTASIGVLTNLITGGHLMARGPALGTTFNSTIQDFVEKAIYAYLIPQAWSLSNEEVQPFILESGFDCSAVNPLPAYMSDADGAATYYCNPGNNKLYYLMSVSGKPTSCTNHPCGINKCTNNHFSKPPGLSALNGSAYGGVIYQDFIAGALAGYTANGNKNGWGVATLSEDAGTAASTLYDLGIRAPGVVMIPVCAPDLAFTNWLEQLISNPLYPCQPNSDTSITRREELLATHQPTRNEDAIPC